ncbi:MAG: heme-degrading domain-containing protein, partial [Rectinema subterraneum]|uniref:heme-degrading domain-containing protein n=1 Tax=Rectinema subterraneum TaxID=2653714 RepID=UPI003C7B46AB
MVPTKDMLDQIAKEEAELVLDQFIEEDAWELGCLMVEEAKKRQARIAIDIRRPGQIMFHAALAGATPDNDEWIRRKSNVVFRFGKASFALGISLALAETTIEQKYFVSPLEFSPHGGAFPIRVRGCGLVACATVSGL